MKVTSHSCRFALLKDGPPGANLFIYGIPSDWTEVTLMRLCQEFGHIVGIRIPRASTETSPLLFNSLCSISVIVVVSGLQRLNKGFGFVSYDRVESSERALNALSGRLFLGKPLSIQFKLGEGLTAASRSINPGMKVAVRNGMSSHWELSKEGDSSPDSVIPGDPLCLHHKH